jgi:hypothetical protein
MHLHELPGDEIQRLAVVAHEGEMGDAGREHAPRHELEWEMDDGHGMIGRFVQRAGCSVPEAPPEGRLYYRPAALPAAEGVA